MKILLFPQTANFRFYKVRPYPEVSDISPTKQSSVRQLCFDRENQDSFDNASLKWLWSLNISSCLFWPDWELMFFLAFLITVHVTRCVVLPTGLFPEWQRGEYWNSGQETAKSAAANWQNQHKGMSGSRFIQTRIHFHAKNTLEQQSYYPALPSMQYSMGNFNLEVLLIIPVPLITMGTFGFR